MLETRAHLRGVGTDAGCEQDLAALRKMERGIGVSELNLDLVLVDQAGFEQLFLQRVAHRLRQ